MPVIINTPPVRLPQQRTIGSTDYMVFRFTDIVCPEGVLRVTMWRQVLPQDAQGTPIVVRGDDRTVAPASIIYTINNEVLSKLPVYHKDSERFFTEAAIDGFSLSIYDSPFVSDIVDQPSDLPLALDRDIEKRLFRNFIKPSDAVDVFCHVGLKERGSDLFTEVVVGQLQNAIDGDDKRLYHQLDSIYLNRLTNREYDAEMFWDLKFVHVALSGIGAIPAEVRYTNDGRGYYLDFFDYSKPAVYPFDDLPVSQLGTPGLKVWQQVASVTTTSQFFTHPYSIWPRHINASKFIRAVLDTAFGAGNYLFECDDSIFTLYGAELQPDQHTIAPNLTTGTKVNLGFEEFVTNWWLLPMCLFGYWDAIVSDIVPIPQNSWYKRFKVAMEIFLEICYVNGWLPLVDTILREGQSVVRIRFKRRGGLDTYFATTVPFDDHHTAFPESESGISVELTKTFQNGIGSHGFFDDWYASKIHDDGSGHIDVTANTAANPQVNPYVVPATAQKPAKLQISLAMGGDESGYPAILKDSFLVGWYMTYPGLVPAFGTEAQRIDEPTTVNFPMLTPLIFHAPGFSSSGEIPTGYVPMQFKPVVGGSFDYVNSLGTTIPVMCTSYRQLLARYYATVFVKSDNKIVRKYGTITEFEDVTELVDGLPNPKKGSRSWQNIDLLYKSEILKRDYYVKSIERDFNTWETTVEYLSAGTGESPFELSDGTLDFQDSPTAPPDKPGVPPVLHGPGPIF